MNSAELSDILEVFCNNPNLSDAVLVLNDKKYYLVQALLQKSAPLLYQEFQEVKATSNLDIQEQQDQVLQNLSQILSSILSKKTLQLTIPNVSGDTSDAVLRSIYGKPIEINTTNVQEIHILSVRFGMKQITLQCEAQFKKSINLDILLKEYQHAIETKSPFEMILKDLLTSKIQLLPKEELLKFTRNLSYETILELIKTQKLCCTEDLVFEILIDWCTNHVWNQDLFLHINFEKVSTNMLVQNKKWIDPDAYVKVIEQKLLKLDTTGSFSPPRQSHMEIIIGQIKQTYPGYRLLTKEEIGNKDFVKLMTDLYIKLDGVYCIDSFNADVICCKDYALGMTNESGYLRLQKINIEKDMIVKFRLVYYSESSIWNEQNMTKGIHKIIATDTMMRHPHDNVGLFILDSIKF